MRISVSYRAGFWYPQQRGREKPAMANERISMRKIRDIIRLRETGSAIDRSGVPCGYRIRW